MLTADVNCFVSYVDFCFTYIKREIALFGYGKVYDVYV